MAIHRAATNPATEPLVYLVYRQNSARGDELMADAKTGDWHREQVIKATRLLLESGGVIEDGLTAVLEAAKREFGCRVVVSTPCRLLVDGGIFVWPEANGHG